MRVAMYYNNRDVRLEEMPRPEIGPGELLVRIRASGICGTDVMEWYRVRKAPLVLGHEIAGEIAGVGEGVGQFRVGDRVFVSHHVPCNRCRYCLSGHHSVCDTLRQTHFEPGGFAEYIRVPRINVELGTFLLPADMSFEEGSFIEPLGCVIRGQKWAKLQTGQSVLVIGSGISGLLHLQLARARRAALVVATDVSGYRLDIARRMGADLSLHASEDVPARLKRINEGRLADLVVVCAGTMSAIQQAVRCVERGGTLLFFAPTPAGVEVPIPLFEFWRNEVTITTSYAANADEIREAIELIRTRQVSVQQMITHRLGLAETGLGFELVASAQDSLKVIIEPQR
ncbi:MAG: alcohol dehydrogenase catalytic domain-containing protein [Deltaproteobacteria bacterium]|nr:alcohol dehydrogenase catalytic domain-containing protein [Deltaproteobacteria bacterium]